MYRSLSLLLLLAPAAPAQGHVWVVDDDPGPDVDYTNLFQAVFLAASGDVLLVRDGEYGPFELTGKGLTIAADADAPVTVGGQGFGYPSFVADVPAGERVVLRGIDFAAGFDFEHLSFTSGLEVLACDGAVWIEDCTLDGGSPGALIVVDSPAVVLDSVVAVGSPGLFNGLDAYPAGAGLRAERSTVRATNSSFLGGKGLNGFDGLPPIASGDGGPGARLLSSQLTLGNGSLQGGVGGDGFVTVWGCQAEGDGGASHVLGDADPPGAAPSAWLANVAQTGGEPGAPATTCDRVADVGPIGGGDAIVDQPPRLLTSSPVREGGLLAATAFAAPGTPTVGLLGVSATAALVPDPGLFGALVVGAPLVVVPLGPIPAAGRTVSITVPDLGPGVESAELLLQVVGCTAAGCLAGEASAVLQLDAAF